MKQKNKKRRRDTFCWLIETAVYLYIMFAGLWTICWLVGEILEKMWVG